MEKTPKTEESNPSFESTTKTNQIFVGGCHPNLQKKDLRDYFSKFGRVTESRLVRHKLTKKFRGFAFVSFQCEKAIEKVMKNKNKHIILGKKVEIKKAYSKKQTTEKLCQEKNLTIYICNVPKKMKREIIKVHFEQFGKVKEVRLVFDKNKKKKNGYGFVVFFEEETIKSVMDQGCFQLIEGKKIDCQRIQGESQEEDEERSFSEGNFNVKNIEIKDEKTSVLSSTIFSKTRNATLISSEIQKKEEKKKMEKFDFLSEMMSNLENIEENTFEIEKKEEGVEERVMSYDERAVDLLEKKKREALYEGRKSNFVRNDEDYGTLKLFDPENEIFPTRDRSHGGENLQLLETLKNLKF